jgi:hypothetical protein
MRFVTGYRRSELVTRANRNSLIKIFTARSQKRIHAGGAAKVGG